MTPKQTYFFGAPDLTAPHAPDSDTSEAAAAAIQPHLSKLQALIMNTLEHHERMTGDGLTCEETEKILKMKHQTASPRFWELKDLCQLCGGRIAYLKARRRCTCRVGKAYIHDQGERRKKQTVWRVVK